MIEQDLEIPYQYQDICNISLQNIENYKINTHLILSEIMEKYSQIVIEYLKYIMKQKKINYTLVFNISIKLSQISFSS